MQKVLRKRVLRDLKENVFRYIALAFLIIMGMYVIVSLIGAGYTIIDNGETHDEANKIEGAQHLAQGAFGRGTGVPYDPSETDSDGEISFLASPLILHRSFLCGYICWIRT